MISFTSFGKPEHRGLIPDLLDLSTPVIMIGKSIIDAETIEYLLAYPEKNSLTLFNLMKGWGPNERADFHEFMKQEEHRPWRIKCGIGFSGKDVALEVLSLLQPVRYLELTCFSEEMIPILKSLPHLQHLDLWRARIPQDVLHTLYQQESLVSKTPHIFLSLSPEHRDLPIEFPPLANKYMQSLALELHLFSFPLMARWIQAASRLENLKYFHLSFSFQFYEVRQLFDEGGREDFVIDPEGTTELMDALCQWISSPSCQLTQFCIECKRGVNMIAPEYIARLLEAIAQNRSLREIDLSYVCSGMQWATEIAPHLIKSNIHHLVLAEGDWGTSEPMLFDWIMQMRNTRLWSIAHSDVAGKDTKMDHVSRIHKDWREKWHPLTTGEQWDATGSHSPTTFIPRHLLGLALEQQNSKSEDNKEEVQALSLDASFYLLSGWVTGISNIPRAV